MPVARTEDLRQYVKRVMRRKNLTLRDIEMRSGGRITDGYVSGIIAGVAKNPSVDKIRALADGLGVEVAEVFHVACGLPAISDGSPRPDPYSSLALLDLMQRVVLTPELLDFLCELVTLPTQERLSLLRTLRSFVREGRYLNGREAG
jgi:transcriptional regulator with XRE-family HTH domain